MTELVSSLDNLHRIFSGRTVVLRSIDMLSVEDRRTALRYLLDAGVTPEVSQDGTGLPQKLRGAVHELTRHFPRNLIVDAAMLELPEDEREAIARCFLPKPSLREKLDKLRAERETTASELKYTLVDSATNGELGKAARVDTEIRVIDGKTGQPVSYKLVKTVPEYDFRDSDTTEPRMLALYRRETGQ